MVLCNCTFWPENSYHLLEIKSSSWWDLLGGYIQIRGKILKAIIILSELCKAFWVEKSHMTPYHPMGGALVEWMNCSLLNLLRTLTKKQANWEDYLQLLFFEYQTSQHSITKLSSYEVLFGQNPTSLQLPLPSTSTSPGPGDYSCQLQQKLIESWDMVRSKYNWMCWETKEELW